MKTEWQNAEPGSEFNCKVISVYQGKTYETSALLCDGKHLVSLFFKNRNWQKRWNNDPLWAFSDMVTRDVKVVVLGGQLGSSLMLVTRRPTRTYLIGAEGSAAIINETPTPDDLGDVKPKPLYADEFGDWYDADDVKMGWSWQVTNGNPKVMLTRHVCEDPKFDVFDRFYNNPVARIGGVGGDIIYSTYWGFERNLPYRYTTHCCLSEMTIDDAWEKFVFKKRREV